ncbi:MAG TPA: hypothetical protein VK817_08395 [Trebonia sp.]|jgi:hypothetical protein|nr:hypothetical protein [Trebonia sp.]
MNLMAARRTLLTGAALAVAGVLIVGCSSQDSSSSASAQAASAPSASVSASVSAAASVSAQSPTASPEAAATSSTAAPSTSFKLVPMQTATGGEFVSPSGNISCEVSLSKVYCQTGTPAQSVTMTGLDGTYKTCTGQECLGNTGDPTPTLAYGTKTGVGPYLCESATAGVTCTTANGDGFLISRSGVTSVSG